MEDLKYLTLAEVETALNKPASAPETRATATKRNIARRQAAPAWWSRDDRPAGETLTGAAGSPGQASGPVRVITGPADFNQLQAGDILVCHYTDPSWTPLFGLAAGVIAETGGRLSHAAIVAREYGIPAVMGAAGATTTLTNGQTITVNGTTGTVTI
ncbi:PEP-utilizing enzyme [Corynebacterium belfantii]|nr:PEP-utilizing enzyme [Corynebacterium belfantii]